MRWPRFDKRTVVKWLRLNGRTAGAAALVLTAGAPFGPGAGAAGQPPPPDLAYRTLETAHFRVTFPEGLAALGRAVAERAEVAYDGLTRVFLLPPPGRIEILLTDHVDESNGSATVAPYPRIVLYARPPVDGLGLSQFEDWLEVVTVHELAHVFHLDVTGGLGRLIRSVFGRVPAQWPIFPQFATPQWTREGLATWYESRLTGSGRVEGSFHPMVVRTAVLEGGLDGIDVVSGASPQWPSGQRAYVYGSLFFDHLLERYGEERMEAFVRAVGGQIVPYRLNAAASGAFGTSFSDAWEAWRSELETEVAALERALADRAPLTEAVRLTGRSRVAFYAEVAPDGRSVVYARSDGRSDAQLRSVALDGSGGEKLTRTNGLAPVSFAPDGSLVLAQLEFTDPYHLRSDLYRLTPENDVVRLTRGARLDHPSVTPDGRSVVAVETVAGATRLVEVELEGGAVRPLAPAASGEHWAWPDVSPDGRWIAASRWRDGGFDVVVLDRGGRVVAELTRDRALDTAPAWGPGGRTLVWSSDRSGIPNLLGATFDPVAGRAGPPRQVTNLLTGAFYPAVDPTGRWIVYSGYHVRGWELERIPFDPEGWFEPFPADPRFVSRGDGAGSPGPDATGEGGRLRPPGEDGPPAPGALADVAGARQAPVRPYSPWRSLRPRFWEPLLRSGLYAGGERVVGPAFGLVTAGTDLVGRHALSLGVLVGEGARLDGALGWRYAGLGNPVLSLSATQGWDAEGPFRGTREDETVARLYMTERERQLRGSASFFLRRFRRSATLTLQGGPVWVDRTLLDDRFTESTEFALPEGVYDLRPTVRLGEVAASLSASTARAYAYSVSAEEGVGGFVRVRARRELGVVDTLRGRPSADGSLEDVIGELRAYRSFPGPGFADHVLALRATGGAARGPAADAFHFELGGATGAAESFSGLELFGGHGYLFPVRGFGEGVRTGRVAWSTSAEYRFPLALVNRGLGLLPLHLDRIAGSLFFDAGNAWGPELGVPGYSNPRRETLTSAGVEAKAWILALWNASLDLRVGVAQPLSGGRSARLHVRLGSAF